MDIGTLIFTFVETEAEKILQSALDLIPNHESKKEFQLKKSNGNFILYVSSHVLEIFISFNSFRMKQSGSKME